MSTNKKRKSIVILQDKNNLLNNKEKNGILEEPSYTITEGNLFYRHFASLGAQSKERKDLISEVVEEKTSSLGAKQVRKWKVKGDIEFGYPSWLDEKVFIAVIDIARRQNYPVINPIQISISELCRTTELNPKSGRNRDMVRASLQRIALTRIEAKDAFYFKEQEAFVDYAFSIFQEVVFAKLKTKGEKASNTLVWLSERVLSNINNGHIRLIDTKLFMNLTPIAGRLYELLSNKFFGLLNALKEKKLPRKGNYIVETYDDLCIRIPVREYKQRSRAIQQFGRAHNQLIETRFLSKVDWGEDNTIHYYPGDKAFYDFDNALREISRQIELPFYKAEKIPLKIEGKKGDKGQITLKVVPEGTEPLEVEENPTDGQISAFMKHLETRGVSRDQAQGLTTDFAGKEIEWGGGSYPVIAFYIQYFDWMMKRKDQKRPESGAWLVDAIRKGWMPPNGFRTKEQLAEAKSKKAEREKRQQETERKRLEEEERRYYFDWLNKTPAERWEVERFTRILSFKKEHGREPTHQELTEDKQNYKKHPETPEAYQKRIFGKVKYPLEG